MTLGKRLAGECRGWLPFEPDNWCYLDPASGSLENRNQLRDCEITATDVGRLSKTAGVHSQRVRDLGPWSSKAWFLPIADTSLSEDAYESLVRLDIAWNCLIA